MSLYHWLLMASVNNTSIAGFLETVTFDPSPNPQTSTKPAWALYYRVFATAGGGGGTHGNMASPSLGGGGGGGQGSTRSYDGFIPNGVSGITANSIGTGGMTGEYSGVGSTAGGDTEITNGVTTLVANGGGPAGGNGQGGAPYGENGTLTTGGRGGELEEGAGRGGWGGAPGQQSIFDAQDGYVIITWSNVPI